jgi:hypothetical protein
MSGGFSCILPVTRITPLCLFNDIEFLLKKRKNVSYIFLIMGNVLPIANYSWENASTNLSCCYLPMLIVLIGLLFILFFLSSMVLKGIVCKKNIAHRRMTSKIDKPRLLILGGALEYQRVSNLLSSVDTLLQQVLNVSGFLSHDSLCF